MRTPVYDMQIFKERREQLAPLIQGSALILAAHPDYIRNNDVNHPYRQDSNFFYLTGFEEPESIFVFRPGKDPESVLFVRKKNPERETWDGFRYGPEMAKTQFKMDATYAVEDFEAVASELLLDVDRVYYSLYFNHDFDRRLRQVLQTVKFMRGRSGRGLLPIEDSYPLLGEMRIRKSDYEAEALRKACQISAEAHIELMRATKPGVNERALHGLFIKEIMERGATREGYNSIVATGNNATTLHYVFNDQVLKDGELLLIDAGGEYQYYTGDITRTYPVNGKFNEAQKRIYNKILQVQKYIISQIQPGMVFKRFQELTISGLVDVMLEEKLLTGSKDQIIKTGEFKKFYPHGVGHWLGLDVHDAGLHEVNKEPRKIEAGFCFTVEPGLYIPADCNEAPAELRGIGIRIEDNVLVTEEGCEVMTHAAPKEVSDLEAIIGTA